MLYLYGIVVPRPNSMLCKHGAECMLLVQLHYSNKLKLTRKSEDAVSSLDSDQALKFMLI
jgi:hypothetical protein